MSDYLYYIYIYIIYIIYTHHFPIKRSGVATWRHLALATGALFTLSHGPVPGSSTGDGSEPWDLIWVGKPLETHRKTIGKWENHRKTIGKWENHGKTIGKP